MPDEEKKEIVDESPEDGVYLPCWWEIKTIVKVPNTTDAFEEHLSIHNVLENPVEAFKPVYKTINKEMIQLTKIIFVKGGYVYTKTKPGKLLKNLQTLYQTNKIDLPTFKIN